MLLKSFNKRKNNKLINEHRKIKIKTLNIRLNLK